MTLSATEYLSIQEKSISGRYVTYGQVADYLAKIEADFDIDDAGKSVQGRMIKVIKLGTGPKRIMIWSQMHGNESTTTKAVLDLLNYLKTKNSETQEILERCSMVILPMLNPDGAEVYTRVNANGIDLNRDAQERTQPESRILRQVFEEFRPDYCFNLHDQRTIYNVGKTNKPATISFLSPAFDIERNISVSRKNSMALIYQMNKVLQEFIPGQVGRYDDAFNPNCVGDTFQMLETPTVLFEAGHYPGDYQREKTRSYIFTALLTALKTLAGTVLHEFEHSLYNEIPENDKLFYDVIVRNVHVINANLKSDDSIGILYKEKLKENTIRFQPEVAKIANLDSHYGHEEYDCKNPRSLEELKKQSFWELVNFRGISPRGI